MDQVLERALDRGGPAEEAALPPAVPADPPPGQYAH